MEKHDHHSGFGNGFVLGLIVGAGLVFFLFTKRGRQLLKVISEEGIEGVEELKGLLDFDAEEEDYEDMAEPKRMMATRTEEAVQRVSKSAKRFFRGVPKRRVN